MIKEWFGADKDFSRMVSRVRAVEECDARDGDQGTEAGKQKIIFK